jgi:hypothetical protein
MRKGDYNYLVTSKKRQMSVESWQDVFKPWGGDSFFSTVFYYFVSTYVISHPQNKSRQLMTRQIISGTSLRFLLKMETLILKLQMQMISWLFLLMDNWSVSLFYVHIKLSQASGKGGASGSVAQSAGTHSLQLLTSTLGLINIEEHMEQWFFLFFVFLKEKFRTRGLQGNVTVNGVDITNSGWNVQPGTLGEYLEVNEIFILRQKGIHSNWKWSCRLAIHGFLKSTNDLVQVHIRCRSYIWYLIYQIAC